MDSPPVAYACEHTQTQDTTQARTHTHNTSTYTHIHMHIRTKGYFAIGGELFFLFLNFFSCSHYKRKEQGPAELKKELTNTTKILQFAKICSTISNFYDWAEGGVGGAV